MLFFLKKPMVGEKFLDFLCLGEKKSWYMDQLRSVVYRLWFTRVLYTLIWSHMLWIAIAIAIIRKIHWWGFRLHCPEKTTKQPPGPDFRCGPWDFFTFWQCLPIRKPYSSPWLQPPGGSLSFGFFAGGDLLDVSATAPWVERFRYEILIQGLEVGYPWKADSGSAISRCVLFFGVGGGYYMRCTAIRCNFEVFYLFLN